MTSTYKLPPLFQSVTATPVNSGQVRLDLAFSTAMAAGGGSIFVTDGSVQTVIDRATGLPKLRIIGATDTHEIPVSSLDFDGNHVYLDDLALKPGHSYSVVMAPGALASSDHLVFGGLTNATGAFATAPVIPPPDTLAPTMQSVTLDGSAMGASGSSVGLTMTFSEAVQALSVGAISAPQANITALHSDDGGRTWHATLTPASGSGADHNVVTVDMTKVHDLSGNAGLGSSSSTASYTVDTRPPATATVTLGESHLAWGGQLELSIHFSEKVTTLDPQAISTPNATLQGLHASEDGTTWYATLIPAAKGLDDATNAVSVDMSQVHTSSGAAGSGSATSGNYVVDTMVGVLVAPALIIDDTGPDFHDFVTRNSETTIGGDFLGTREAGQSVLLKIDGVAVGKEAIVYNPEADITHGQAQWSFGGGALADGQHTIEVTVTDAAGHASTPVTQTITVDTKAPAITDWLSTEDRALAVGSPIVIHFDEAVHWVPGLGNVETLVGFDRVELVDETDHSTWVSIDETNLSEDHKTLTIATSELGLVPGYKYTLYLPDTLTDLAGNGTADHPLQVHFTESIAPHALGASVTKTPGAYGAGAIIDIEVVFNEPMKLAAGATPTLALGNGGHAVFSELIDGGRSAMFSYAVGVEDVNGLLALSSTAGLLSGFSDLSGNALVAANIDFAELKNTHAEATGSNIVIDTVGPAALAGLQLDSTVDTGAIGDLITARTELLFTGTGAEADNLVRLYDGETLVATVNADAGGKWSLNGTLIEGTHHLAVNQMDAAGNVSLSTAPVTLIVDHTVAKPPAPLLESDTGTLGDNITRLPAPNIKGSGVEAGAKVEVIEGTTVVGTGTADNGGGYSIKLSALPDGLHSLSVRQTDLAGNQSELSGALGLTIDTAVSGLTASLSAVSDTGVSSSDRITNYKRPILEGTGAEPGAAINLYDGETKVATGYADANGKWSVQPTMDLGDGIHSFSVETVDAAGNTSAHSGVVSVTIDTLAPTIAWTKTVGSGAFFELWFSETVLHGSVNTGSLYDDLTHLATSVTFGENWVENTQHEGITTTLLRLVPGHSGHLTVDLSTVQDAAGNHVVVDTSQFDFTVIPPLAVSLPTVLY
jgi:hypothetical protein